MKHFKVSLMAAIAAFFMSGCAQINAVYDALQPAGKVALQTAKTTDALIGLDSDYRQIRQSINQNWAVFTEDEQLRLREGNNQIVIARSKFDEIKLGSGGTATILVNTSELVDLIHPVRNALSEMIAVMDERIGQFNAQTQIKYIQARSDYALIDTHIQRLIDESDARIKTQMVRNILKIAAQVLGVAKIALEHSNET